MKNAAGSDTRGEDDKDKATRPPRAKRKIKLTCNDNCSAGAGSGQGARLADAVAGVRRAKRRMAVIEGNPVDVAGLELEPRLLENVVAIQAYLDNRDPHFADLRHNIETELCRSLIHDLEKIEARLDRVEGAPRRRHFRVISGGRGT
jgi:hypothetical protein